MPDLRRSLGMERIQNVHDEPVLGPIYTADDVSGPRAHELAAPLAARVWVDPAHRIMREIRVGVRVVP